MEETRIDKEAIEALEVDEVEVIKKVASKLDIKLVQVNAVVTLLKEGSTVPFIARYRKEQHGNLDEVAIREIEHLFTSYSGLEARRIEILKGILAQDKLTPSLYEAVTGAGSLVELEDIWAPFKKKKLTRGMVAIQKGLTPLADAMETLDDTGLESLAEELSQKSSTLGEEIKPYTKEEALQGANDIVAERVSQSPDNRKTVDDLYMGHGKIVTKGIGEDENSSTYKIYWDFSEPLREIKPHRILAINRGEREKALDVTIEVDIDGAVAALQSHYGRPNKYLPLAVEDGVVRLLSPSVVREIRSRLTEMADDHGIGIFSENLKNLLMTRPLKGTKVLGIDPGIRTGTKCAVLDETGKYIGYFLIKQVADPEGAKKLIKEAISKYSIQVVAVGNGTGSPEVQEIVASILSEDFPNTSWTVVDESGASVYSASDIAREEFPDLDLTIRGAISMGRRLQDPLSELVKIDPKSIGVGLYQHDVNQSNLGKALDEVVSSVVNQVGVNLNTASYSLLKYVSGINSSVAKKIVAYRNTNGVIHERDELLKISGLGPKTYEQCAGFLKIPESSDPLDNTWVHPENYPLARKLLPMVHNKETITKEFKESAKKEYNVGEETLDDIIQELKKPNLDPRDTCPPPLMQKGGVVKFEDLKPGMTMRGKVRNVVDFGAFVDIGLHETALIHVSELSDSYVKDPLEVIHVGDTKDFIVLETDPVRKRISLSLKSNAKARATAPKDSTATESSGNGAHKKKVVVVKKPLKSVPKREGRRASVASGSDDGMYYNPFAALLKK